MNPNGGPLSCPIYSCLDKYKVTPRKPQVEYTVSSFNVLLVHCKCFDHKNYGDWKKRGPCRENLHYLWKRAVRIVGFPRNSVMRVGSDTFGDPIFQKTSGVFGCQKKLRIVKLTSVQVIFVHAITGKPAILTALFHRQCRFSLLSLWSKHLQCRNNLYQLDWLTP